MARIVADQREVAAHRGAADLDETLDAKWWRRLPIHWPLSAIVLLYPVWWLLGVASFVPIAMAVPMMWQLRRRRPVLLPRGGGWWLVFLVWVLLGIFVLNSDAPGVVPGGGGFGRLLVWGYGLSWYIACTVALVWVANLRRDELSLPTISAVLSWLYVFSTVGGLVGVILPTLDFKSVLEMVLPGSLADNSLVKSLVHPGIADTPSILGRPEARPKAPFAYANTWGSVVALSLPFFLLSWLKWGKPWMRVLAPLVLTVSVIPIVYSLNRGLWACLAAGAVYLAICLAWRGRFGAVLASLLILALATLVFVASPLGDLVSERFQHQHSNERRGDLLVLTVESLVMGSPVVGFGSTRDVQGNFDSIAGGATPACPICGVPPLGTQGQLWLVLFTQGLPGVVFFLMFFLSALWRSIRTRTLSGELTGAIVLFFVIQVFVYDTRGLPLLIVMIAIGEGWRDHIGIQRSDTLRGLLADVSRYRAVIAVLAASGVLIGTALAFSTKREYVAENFVLLRDTPSYLPTELGGRSPRRSTIDTEAALVVSEETLVQLVLSDEDKETLRQDVEVTAVTNTQVLVISLKSTDADGLVARVQQLSNAYLKTRREFLLNRRTQVLSELYDQSASLAKLGNAADLQAVTAAINKTLLTSTDAGEVLLSEGPRPVSRDFLKHSVSGAAIGLMVGFLLVAFRIGRPELRRRAEEGAGHSGTAARRK